MAVSGGGGATGSGAVGGADARGVEVGIGAQRAQKWARALEEFGLDSVLALEGELLARSSIVVVSEYWEQE